MGASDNFLFADHPPGTRKTESIQVQECINLYALDDSIEPLGLNGATLLIQVCLGSTFEFRRKKLVGSYLFLRATKRE